MSKAKAKRGPEKVMLDLGAMGVSPPGFTPMGYHHGSEIYPLDIPDESVDIIRASHVLEHFPHGLVGHVLANWASKLKPGGTLKIAVPNLHWIAERYLAGDDAMVQLYLMGGQTDKDDFHYCAFDDELLSELLRTAGLIEVSHWESDCEDCSRLPVSLNLQAIKPRKLVPAHDSPFKVAAVMSVPRLGFMNNFYCTFEALAPMGIKLRRHMGAYWEISLERTISAAMAEDEPDAILTLDYDSVYTRGDVEKLIQTMRERPEVDALAAVQSARHADHCLLTLTRGNVGVKEGRCPPGVFADDITELRTAHFGLTLIRTSSLRKLPKPWLQTKPAADGTYADGTDEVAGRIDADISFWHNWREAGLKVFSANRVVIGHLELMIRWPGRDMETVLQLPQDWQRTGKPGNVWR